MSYLGDPAQDMLRLMGPDVYWHQPHHVFVGEGTRIPRRLKKRLNRWVGLGYWRDGGVRW